MAASALFLSKQHYRLLQYLPPIVLLYLGVMLVSSWELFEKNDAITQSYLTLKSNLLPAMLFLMLLPNRITTLFDLGPKMLFTFFLASLSLFIAFILCFILFGLTYEEVSILAPLAGSWMGGTANMVAVSSFLESSEEAIGIIMLVDSVDYSLWVMLLLLLVPYASRFNSYTKAIDPVEDVNIDNQCALHFSYRSYIWLLLSAMAVSLFSQISGLFLSKFLFGSVTAWSVILATLAGIIFSFTPLSKTRGLQSTANAMLYLIIALIASRATIHFDDMGLFLYIAIGMSVLFIHALFMLLFAKLFKLDLFSISVASLANVGGIASAPILSAAYAQSLVGVGVIMATLGYVIGTFAALILTEILRWLA